MDRGPPVLVRHGRLAADAVAADVVVAEAVVADAALGMDAAADKGPTRPRK